ncbi:MAG: TlpA disulfide reductase family protein [Solirubrobacteraceae bacterium]
MTHRRAIAIFVCLAALALIGVGIPQLPHDSSGGSPNTRLTAAQASALLAGSPPALAALHVQGGKLLDGGASAFNARLAALKGHPIVINKWASWCVPCKEEFAAFQRVSAEYGRRVAFVGIDSEDPKRADSQAFLRSFPVSYPSYYDPSGHLGIQVTDSSFIPVTVFKPLHGRPFIYQGQLPSASRLREEVKRYALGE